MIYLRIAWRNIWRSRRRSLITMGSVCFAVILAIVMRSVIDGVFEKMVTDVVGISTGYLQVHRTGYWEERSLENSFILDEEFKQELEQDPDISAWAPRLESFSLASTGIQSRGVAVIGIVPSQEDEVAALSGKLSSGRFLTDYDRSVLIAEGLGERLGVSTGDTLVLLGYGYHGSMAAGQYPIAGTVRLGSVELNQSIVWLPLMLAQEYLSADSLITSITVNIKDYRMLDPVQERLTQNRSKTGLQAMTWQEMLPELDQLIEGDKSAHMISIYLLYFVISFGILGTLLMMLKERMHEFGILIAIGMYKRTLILITTVELMMIGFCGTLAGMVITIPLLLYFRANPIRLSGELAQVYERFGMEPIIPPAVHARNFLAEAAIVLLILAILSLYPAFRISRLNVMSALRD